MTLDTRILVSKVFTHVLNVTYITGSQIDLIQKLISEFIWKGHNRICQSVMCAGYQMGGFKMLYAKEVVHSLHVKWMKHLSQDCGTFWSRFAWPLYFRD